MHVGDTVYVGGVFTSITLHDIDVVIPKANIFAYSARPAWRALGHSRRGWTDLGHVACLVGDRRSALYGVVQRNADGPYVQQRGLWRRDHGQPQRDHGLRNRAGVDDRGVLRQADRARLYFTLSGQTSLFYRYFEPLSQMVGGQRFTAQASTADVSWSQVGGMFLAANTSISRTPPTAT